MTSETTNLYWQESLRTGSFTLQIIATLSTYLNQAGEMLAYYYFHKYRLFEKAIVIHDSVVIQAKLEEESFYKLLIKIFIHVYKKKDWCFVKLGFYWLFSNLY